jgi:protein-L-isoaspartate(D-aspartate) O-methyltransferase
VEYHESLAEDARETLAAVGYEGVSVRAGDGKAGWPEHAPFDRVYFTCAAEELPSAVVDQLDVGGILLAPVGTGRQRLVRAEKRPDGSLDRDPLMGVRFVPLQ